MLAVMLMNDEGYEGLAREPDRAVMGVNLDLEVLLDRAEGSE